MGRGVWDPKVYVPKMAQSDFPNGAFRFVSRWSLWSEGGGGVTPAVYCCVQPAVPIGLSPLTLALPFNPLPLQAAAPIGLSPPRALPLPPPGLSLPPRTPPSIPLGVCANRAPTPSLFHCSVSGPHGGGQPPSPLATCVQADTPIRAVGDPSPMAAFGPQDVHLRGHFPALGGGGGSRGGG